MKVQKRDESELVTKLVGVIVTNIFIQLFFQIPCKIFATQCLFNDHLKRKTVNKTTCRIPSANPRQLCKH